LTSETLAQTAHASADTMDVVLLFMAVLHPFGC
jgi:hypothetical protein